MGQMKDNGVAPNTTAAKINTPGINTQVIFFRDTVTGKIQMKDSTGVVYDFIVDTAVVYANKVA